MNTLQILSVQISTDLAQLSDDIDAGVSVTEMILAITRVNEKIDLWGKEANNMLGELEDKAEHEREMMIDIREDNMIREEEAEKQEDDGVDFTQRDPLEV